MPRAIVWRFCGGVYLEITFVEYERKKKNIPGARDELRLEPLPLLLPIRGVEVVTCPFDVIAVHPSCACRYL